MVGITNVFDVNGCKLTVNSNNKMSFIAFCLNKQTNNKTIIAPYSSYFRASHFAFFM
jgi:hypothetical protein